MQIVLHPYRGYLPYPHKHLQLCAFRYNPNIQQNLLQLIILL